ncbi:Adenylate kinase [Seminavis robusta]|uniref:Adenylate kinase n=1 Tax=Seminavis robusta TaxID=568900 RepID=A0A9N8EAQ8_9STRA|nr:Adenylate kinase [Seminavis robusta]|eukprot:Sro695_g188640.1 Adenylate kinase (581) ;mRNA; r:10575-12467
MMPRLATRRLHIAARGRHLVAASARVGAATIGAATIGSGKNPSWIQHYWIQSANHHGHARSFASTSIPQQDDLDDLCRKHMDLPAQEFAMGCSFLHQVALGINPSELDKLLRVRPSLVNFRDYDRRTPLHIAASEGHLEICQFLVEKGARINRSDRWGGSPLDDSHRQRHGDVIKFLKEHGATFGSPSQANNFITAASEGDYEEVKALLEFGNMDINHGDYDRRTALHLAAGEGRAHVVRLLCEAGADVNVKDRWGNQPLDDAMASNNQTCIAMLEKFGGTQGSNASSDVMGEEALLDLIHTYGKVRDGVLSMDWHDVKELLEGVGEDHTDEVVQKLFEVADVNGTGIIDTEAFMTHSDTFLGGRPARIILVVGGPGSGKGVLCERLVKECGVVHLSSGELLRDEVTRGTELGKQVEEIMKSGGLVSSAIMVTLMQKRMKDHPGKRILLDGFPRSQENAEDLVTLCGKPELALHLTCDDTVLLERVMKRGQSGERADDNFDTAIERVRTYHKYHHLTLEFLRQENVPIVFLDCSATPDGVWEQLTSIGRLMRSAVKLPLGGTNGNANSSSQEYSSSFEIP